MRRLASQLLLSSKFITALTHPVPSSLTLRILQSRSYSTKTKTQLVEFEELQQKKSDQIYPLDFEYEDQSPFQQNLLETEKGLKVFYPPNTNRFKLQQKIESLQGVQIPQLYENLNFEQEIEPFLTRVRDTFQYNNEELKYLLKRNKKAFTPQCQPEVVKSFYVDQLQFPYDKVRSMVLRGPVILIKNQEFLKDQYKVMKETLNLSDEEILYYFIQVPELLHWSGTYHILEIYDRFELYMGWDEKQVTALFKESPWMLAQTIDKIENLLKLFRGYKFDPQILYEVLMKDGSVFGTPPSVLRQSIRLLRQNFKLRSREILKDVLVKHPQYLLQSKFRALQTKLELLRQNGCSELMIRRVFQHYPQFYLKSISSFQAKIKYLKKNCRIDLATNPHFPLCLMFDFRSVIYPRLECLGASKIKKLNLAKILRPKDEKFCTEFNITMEELESRKLDGTGQEKDVLWRYVANI